MVQDGDVFQITDVQFDTLNNVEFLNVYNYQFTTEVPLPTWGVVAPELATKFSETIVNAVCTVQANSIYHTSVRIKNMNSPYEEYEFIYPLPLAGDVFTAGAPSFVTLYFKYLRQTSSTRNGRKSIGGLPEEFTSGQNGRDFRTNSTVLALANALSLPLAVESDFSTDALYIPIIYRPVSTELGPPVINYINDVRYEKNGTQNTRK